MEYSSFLNVILFQFTASVRVAALALPPSPDKSRSNKPDSAVAAAAQSTSASSGLPGVGGVKVFLVLYV